jgi:acetamidase/formamidase
LVRTRNQPARGWLAIARCVPQDAPFSDDHPEPQRGRGRVHLSVAVDFGVTQVVDGNWGVHAIIIKKNLLAGSPA